jgi:hypothetical protein
MKDLTLNFTSVTQRVLEVDKIQRFEHDENSHFMFSGNRSIVIEKSMLSEKKKC